MCGGAAVWKRVVVVMAGLLGGRGGLLPLFSRIVVVVVAVIIIMIVIVVCWVLFVISHRVLRRVVVSLRAYKSFSSFQTFVRPSPASTKPYHTTKTIPH